MSKKQDLIELRETLKDFKADGDTEMVAMIEEEIVALEKEIEAEDKKPAKKKTAKKKTAKKKTAKKNTWKTSQLLPKRRNCQKECIISCLRILKDF